ncbi:hypothetical protein [Paenibacillus sp. FSL L8-0708]|uniref:hypothetical protein n=1 Tax=Paenibacillus sp. FSL L8-0708 TaxID=2975311 RepID=UPI0030FBEA35
MGPLDIRNERNRLDITRVVAVAFMVIGILNFIPVVHSMLSPIWFIWVGALSLIITLLAELENSQAIIISIL